MRAALQPMSSYFSVEGNALVRLTMSGPLQTRALLHIKPDDPLGCAMTWFLPRSDGQPGHFEIIVDFPSEQPVAAAFGRLQAAVGRVGAVHH